MQSYFLPPTRQVYPEIVPIQHYPWGGRIPDQQSPSLRRMMGVRRIGVESFEVAGIKYPGGRWSGPLTDFQISSLIAAGYGDRIVRVKDASQLPTGLD